ncbi:MAG TPA: FGGY family carbohydrate kinase [Jatrophihabitans sp.]|nr:FGGY family carbohydrate kinase [Jatrophihabitans sp.]
MALVAGIDSSTQSCKVVVRDLDTGRLIRSGAAPHPAGTEIDPAAWEDALQVAIGRAGGLADVDAISVAAQQHGMVCLDERGDVVRAALLWNDTRSADAASDLVRELDGGASAWASAVGSVPLASFTISKLRWLAEHEPSNAARAALVCLPHDWLTWRMSRSSSLDDVATDRSDASGTGYWSPATGRYRTDLLELAMGRAPQVPQVLAPEGRAGRAGGCLLAAGAGDNAAAALGLGARPGDVVISVGTSGVVSAVGITPASDPSGTVAGFADATGRFLPLVCTLNGARVFDTVAELLGVSLKELADLAVAAPAGASGLALVPYFAGERTPNRPDSTAAIHGLTLANSTRSNLARAAIEGLLCGLADGVDALRAAGCVAERVFLIGGAAKSEALCEIAPAVLGLPVLVPQPGEYVADGAARQAAWALTGALPAWQVGQVNVFDAAPTPAVRERYAEVAGMTASQL